MHCQNTPCWCVNFRSLCVVCEVHHMSWFMPYVSVKVHHMLWFMPCVSWIPSYAIGYCVAVVAYNNHAEPLRNCQTFWVLTIPIICPASWLQGASYLLGLSKVPVVTGIVLGLVPSAWCGRTTLLDSNVDYFPLSFPSQKRHGSHAARHPLNPNP